MSNDSDRRYHADYQRQLRARARQAGFAQLNTLLPSELVARLDGLKAARGLANRNEALAMALREYFDIGDNERTKAVSP